MTQYTAQDDLVVQHKCAQIRIFAKSFVFFTKNTFHTPVTRMMKHCTFWYS